MELNKHKAIIFGRKVRKIYEVSHPWYSKPEIIESYKTQDDRVIIFEGDIENPPIKEGEEIFIKALNKTIKIFGKARNVDGGYVYFTNYVTETIVNEETEKSKEIAKIELERALQEYQEEEERNNKKEREDEYNNLPWYIKVFTKRP